MVEAKSNSLVPVALLEKFSKLGQEHVFKFFTDLTEEERDLFIKQLESFNLENVLSEWKKAVTAAQDPAKRFSPDPLHNDDIIIANEEERSKFWDCGIEAIQNGKVAVVTLAGGQGTRLGSLAPKGCYDIGLPSRMSLFELQGLRLSKLTRLSKSKEIPWYVMTSEVTRKETEKYFISRNYFGLNKESVKFFNQGVLPAINDDGKLFLKTNGSLAMSPDGNGGIYTALKNEGILEELKSNGVEYVHMYCVDNALVKICDPWFIGGCIKRSTDCAAKSIIKTDPNESVGIFCRKEGKLIVAEYSELDSNVANHTDKDGNLIYNQANIANHFFKTSFLEKVSQGTLPFHLARKKIPCIDENGDVMKETPMGYKLESFIFDVFSLAERPLLYQVERLVEFAPLKNASGAEKDSPEYCRRLVLDLHKQWLLKAGAIPSGEVEISPLLSYAGEGLEDYKDQKIQVQFLKSNNF